MVVVRIATFYNDDLLEVLRGCGIVSSKPSPVTLDVARVVAHKGLRNVQYFGLNRCRSVKAISHTVH